MRSGNRRNRYRLPERCSLGVFLLALRACAVAKYALPYPALQFGRPPLSIERVIVVALSLQPRTCEACRPGTAKFLPLLATEQIWFQLLLHFTRHRCERPESVADIIITVHRAPNTSSPRPKAAEPTASPRICKL
jgi:hypothetical protein